jgi:hypothetical protein
MAAASLMAAGALSAKAQTSAPLTEAPATTPAAPSAQVTEAPPTGIWISGIRLSAQIDAGFMGNPSRPADGLNFGQLFTDHANQFQLNQVLLTAQKPLDPKNLDYQ